MHKPKIDREIYVEHKANDNLDEVDGIFSPMKPIPGAIKAIDFLSQHFGV